jgi:uncharacterized protein YecT (DUF1311 family)
MRPPNWIALVLALLMSAAFSQSHAKFDQAFSRCMKANDQGSLGTSHCYGDQLNRLEIHQKSLIQKLETRFKSPKTEGMRYDEALIELKKSQNAWIEFVRADCFLGDSIFGIGNAARFEIMHCHIDHYFVRNSRLKKLLADS